MSTPTDPTDPYQQGAPGTEGPNPSFGQQTPSGSPYQESGPYQQPAGGYQQPGPGYGQPNPGYAAANGPVTADAMNNVKLNLWLSVFFSWIPALIFWVSQKDNVPENVRQLHRDNLNFTLLRVIVGAIAIIPIVGWIVGGIGSLVLWIFQLIAAIKAPEEIAAGGTYKFQWVIPIVK